MIGPGSDKKCDLKFKKLKEGKKNSSLISSSNAVMLSIIWNYSGYKRTGLYILLELTWDHILQVCVVWFFRVPINAVQFNVWVIWLTNGVLSLRFSIFSTFSHPGWQDGTTCRVGWTKKIVFGFRPQCAACAFLGKTRLQTRPINNPLPPIWRLTL